METDVFFLVPPVVLSARPLGPSSHSSRLKELLSDSVIWVLSVKSLLNPRSQTAHPTLPKPRVPLASSSLTGLSPSLSAAHPLFSQISK